MTWKEEFQDALKEALMDRAGSTIGTWDYYGFAWDDEATMHFRIKTDAELQAYKNRMAEYRTAVKIPAWCGSWAAVDNCREDSRYEFNGTDQDPDYRTKMVADVTCTCGFIKDKQMYWENVAVAELIRELTGM